MYNKLYAVLFVFTVCLFVYAILSSRVLSNLCLFVFFYHARATTLSAAERHEAPQTQRKRGSAPQGGRHSAIFLDAR